MSCCADFEFRVQVGPQFSDVKYDTYGFFHGWKFTKAIHDYQLVGGKAIMVPKQAMGIWWSRWYDLNNYDTQKVVDDYETRDIPLDIFVIDMGQRMGINCHCLSSLFHCMSVLKTVSQQTGTRRTTGAASPSTRTFFATPQTPWGISRQRA